MPARARREVPSLRRALGLLNAWRSATRSSSPTATSTGRWTSPPCAPGTTRGASGPTPGYGPREAPSGSPSSTCSRVRARTGGGRDPAAPQAGAPRGAGGGGFRVALGVTAPGRARKPRGDPSGSSSGSRPPSWPSAGRWASYSSPRAWRRSGRASAPLPMPCPSDASRTRLWASASICPRAGCCSGPRAHCSWLPRRGRAWPTPRRVRWLRCWSRACRRESPTWTPSWTARSKPAGPWSRATGRSGAPLRGSPVGRPVDSRRASRKAGPSKRLRFSPPRMPGPTSLSPPGAPRRAGQPSGRPWTPSSASSRSRECSTRG